MGQQITPAGSLLATYGKRRSTLRTCLHVVPWWTFASAALFAAGLVMWAVCAAQTKQYSLQFASLLGASEDSTAFLGRAVNTAILAFSIAGIVAASLVVVLAFMRTAQRSMLLGACCCSCDRPAPWVFTLYRFLNGLLALAVWTLLLAVVMLLMAMLLWLGAAVAVQIAISEGTKAGNAALPNGGFAAANDLSNALVSAFNGVLPGQVSSALSSSVCPPVCLNLGSFGVLLNLESSCLCGTQRLADMQGVAEDATQSSAIALGGAGAMYLATTFLLMILTAHQVTAGYDKKAVRALDAHDNAVYENGAAADPADCVAPLSVDVSRQPSGAPAAKEEGAGASGSDLELAPARYSNGAPSAPPAAMSYGGQNASRFAAYHV